MNERDYSWAITALGQELQAMEQIEDGKVGKPGSPYSISLLKIASIIKGAGAGYLPAGICYHSMRQATQHLGVSEREAMRMFGRAMKNARPRFPKE